MQSYKRKRIAEKAGSRSSIRLSGHNIVELHLTVPEQVQAVKLHTLI